MTDPGASTETDGDVNNEESAPVRSRLQYATDFQRLALREPEKEQPLNVLRFHIGRLTKVTDVLAVPKSIVFKSECFQLNRRGVLFLHMYRIAEFKIQILDSFTCTL